MEVKTVSFNRAPSQRVCWCKQVWSRADGLRSSFRLHGRAPSRIEPPYSVDNRRVMLSELLEGCHSLHRDYDNPSVTTSMIALVLGVRYLTHFSYWVAESARIWIYG